MIIFISSPSKSALYNPQINTFKFNVFDPGVYSTRILCVLIEAGNIDGYLFIKI